MFRFLTIISLIQIIFGYNLTSLINGVWLSGSAYCGKDVYSSMKLGGPVSDLVYKHTLYDIKTDIQGYIGILPSTKTINIVLRGSSSKINWIYDFEIKQVNYDTFPECNCKVHNGFYKSALNIRNETITYVKILMKLNPTYNIFITGHSYGASVGHLLGLELVKENIKVQIYDYGQPRTGDKTFASFSKSKIDNYWRTTHDKDIVPHIPPIKGFNYYHVCGEIFEDVNGTLYECSHIFCEDNNCSNQYQLSETNIDDHLYYLGHRLSCEDSTQ